MLMSYILDAGNHRHNMNDLAASIGLAQLKKLDEMNNKRIEIVRKYLEGIKDCKNVTPSIPYDLTTTYYSFLVRIAHKKRDDFIIHMQKKEISSGVHTMPIPMLRLYKNFHADIPIAMKTWDEHVVVPLYVGFSNKEIDYIIESIIEFDNLY